jgi:hypothetical protein
MFEARSFLIFNDASYLAYEATLFGSGYYLDARGSGRGGDGDGDGRSDGKGIHGVPFRRKDNPSFHIPFRKKDIRIPSYRGDIPFHNGLLNLDSCFHLFFKEECVVDYMLCPQSRKRAYLYLKWVITPANLMT